MTPEPTAEPTAERPAAAADSTRPVSRRRVWTAAGVTVILPALVICGAAVWAWGGGPADAPGSGTVHRLDATGHFFLAAAVVLAAALAGGACAQRLGQPRVIGEICAGLALGPSLLGSLAPDATGWLFPGPSVRLMEGLSQLGLALFMFGVGQELAGMRLRGTMGRTALVSLASLLVPFGLGAAAALPMAGAFTGTAGNETAFVLFVGCAMSITAFPVLARILADLGLTRSEPGRLALVVAAIGDGGSWLVVAAIVTCAQGGGVHGLVVNGLGAALAAVFFLWPLRRWLARRLPDTEDGRGAVGVTVLLVAGVAAASTLTAALGIHQLIGALLFGLAWPVRGQGAALADRVTGIAKTVLLPFFFFGFGLATDLTALHWDATTAAVCAGLLLVATVGKIAGPGLCAWLTGMDRRPALILGMLLNARGLTELVVIQIGFQAGLVDDGMRGVLTLVALVTTVMTSPLLRLLGCPPSHRLPVPVPVPVMDIPENPDPSKAPDPPRNTNMTASTAGGTR
ncbi:putative Na(+)/H(+) antiporter [Streptomyces sp. NBRC 110611]|uniref:cation:proton antiporter domain-containing protein n=1 Tax=Streptomyces sp. NBRC 110611 TaxID=1621259 RepID=UPI000833322C|nr:cation:proton antiporter [Streptomyces sp. NBRC 110611]GAU68737.1 putative Na(+)/H(+) antiporter [Streptomyces sp. NBRC 110611]